MTSSHHSENPEHPSTYFVQDRQNKDELARLTIQDTLITVAMGGVLPEQSDPESFRRVLDVACGPGEWAIKAAQMYPNMSLFGIDISKRMIDYAQTQAVANQVSDRIEFRTMDALRMLDFPTGFFDLVNLRFGVSFLRTWDWPKMLGELQRVTRPGGVVRVTDTQMAHQSTSPAFTLVQESVICAFFRAGHLFEQKATGLTDHLAPLFIRHGVQNVQSKVYELEYLAGTPQGQAFYEDMQHVFRTIRPFLQKWGCVPQDYDTLCQQALVEMQQIDFQVIWKVFTTWGTSPEKESGVDAAL
jgi:ubiquinone/menaquinone biosynthesis C-methylase UbiE